MHLGNLFAYLCAWLSVRSQGGELVLRIEDLDLERTRSLYADQCMRDFEWLGLTWDRGPYYQHDNYDRYREAFDRLYRQRLVYPCFCSRADWHAASAPHRGDRFIYPGTCRHLSESEIGLRAAEKAPAWRFYLGAGSYSFTDLFQGSQTFSLQDDCGDVVIRRADGAFAYQLACVVDDEEEGITEVVRGYDLLDSVPTQASLQRALGFRELSYGHVPILQNPSGQRLAKRDKSICMEELKADFATPQKMLGHIAYVGGFVEADAPCDLEDLLALWDPGSLNRESITVEC